MYRSLLVPLDGSAFSEQALPIALSLARRAGAALEVAHVHTPFEYYRVPSAVAPDLDEKARKDKQYYLDGIVNRLGAEGKVTATSTLLVGHAADALHDHAVAQGIDLVVMTTHGRGPLSRFWLGSVADDLMRRLPMPVLLVRPQEPVPDAGQEPVFRHVLIPLDGSELAEQILEPAVALGTLMEAEYTLLRIVEPLLEFDDDVLRPRTRLFSSSLYAETAVMRERQHVEAQNYLLGVANRLRSQSLPIQVRVVPDLHPAAAILNEARDHGIDLIALATRGLGGLARLVLGSVADKVVRGATTPVLVYRPRNK
jgi:nucleotide-binding universal stress UspA family protein